ncbi:hypothetical protein ABPG77_001812 [Micractinium sp. CCAP 211/92]
MPAAPHPHDEAAAWAQGMQDLAVSLAQIGVKSPVSLQRQHRRRQQHRAQAFDPELKRRQPRCAVYSGVRFHADVAAGLLWAFQEAGCTVTAYMHPVAWRSVKNVVLPWFKGARRMHTAMLAEAGQYDVIVLATFPEPKFAGTQAALLQGKHAPPPHQRLLLVSHNPGHLLSGCTTAAQPWLRDLLAAQVAAGEPPNHAPRLQLLTLAPCVSNFTAAMLAGWAAERQLSSTGHGGSSGAGDSSSGGSMTLRVEVPWMAPLVPWQGRRAGKARHLCIQGSLNPRRRDYAGAFAAASHPAVLAQLRARNESLLLVGSGSDAGLPVPPVLRPHVRILANLPYEDYYATLSNCRAILTAFGSDVYITNKASSTLAAALQVGTPVLTEDSVLAAYAYLRPTAAYSYRRSVSLGSIPQAAALGSAAGREAALDPAGQCSMLSSATVKQGGTRVLQRKLSAGEELPSDAQRADGMAAALEQPPAGSYEAALLATFDDEANQAAHAAAWQLKLDVMRHNIRLAARSMTAAAAIDL